MESKYFSQGERSKVGRSLCLIFVLFPLCALCNIIASFSGWLEPNGWIGSIFQRMIGN